jgi:anthranilate synthase component 1
MKKHIVAGDVFQIVPSRTFRCSYAAEPFDIYKELRNLNPSPYMFYFKNSKGILLGSSPETFIKVEGEKEKTVEIRPIAGTRKRGIVNGRVDADLDSRLENELRMDSKELAEHTMLVDLARNDIARVSVPGTRTVDRPHYVEKYSHVMHLVSNVNGKLKPELDALHAYLASMNMGTLTGAPKVKAMELLRKYEKQKRGFYGGSVGYLTPSNDFDSCIVIRSMRIKNGEAFIRAGAGIVYDSIPEKEARETEQKARACIDAIKLSQGDLK